MTTRLFFWSTSDTSNISEVMSYHSPIKNTLNSDSKSLVSECVGTLNNDDHRYGETS